MANRSYLVWQGDRIKRRADKQAEAALNDTAEEGAALASQFTAETFNVITGAAADSWEPGTAQKRGGLWQVEYGSYGVRYVAFLNDGTIYIEPGHMLQRSADIVLPQLEAKFAGGGLV